MRTDRQPTFPNPYPTAPPEMERILITEPLAAQDAENLAHAEHIATEVLELAGLQNMPAGEKSDDQRQRERDLITELPDAEFEAASALSAAAKSFEVEAQQIGAQISDEEAVYRRAVWQGFTDMASTIEAGISDLRTRSDEVVAEGASLFAQTRQEVTDRIRSAAPAEVTLDPVAFWSTDGTATALPLAAVERTPSVMETVDPGLVGRVAELEAELRSLRGVAEEPELATATEDPSPTGAPADDEPLPVDKLFAGDDLADATDDEARVPTWSLSEPTGDALVAADTDGLGGSGSFIGWPTPRFMPASPPPAPVPEPQPSLAPDPETDEPGVFDGGADDDWASFAPAPAPEDDPWGRPAIDPFAAPIDADGWGEPEPTGLPGDDEDDDYDIPAFLRDDPVPLAPDPFAAPAVLHLDTLAGRGPVDAVEPTSPESLHDIKGEIIQAFEAAWSQPGGVDGFSTSPEFQALMDRAGRAIELLPLDQRSDTHHELGQLIADLRDGKFDENESAAVSASSSDPEETLPQPTRAQAVAARRAPPQVRRTGGPRRPRRPRGRFGGGSGLSPRD